MPLHPQVEAYLKSIADLPPVWSLPVDEARRNYNEAAPLNAGPLDEVAQIEDRLLPGPEGEVPVRIYTPTDAGAGTFVFFHGGGWVLGNLDSDDPLCRDLCARSGAVVLSVNYRHAPEVRFPAAALDAFAAVRWADANAIELGGIPGQLAVAGWSAGGNVAAVACQLARDAGGPHISGQLLFCPAVDSDLTRPSYEENGDGYILTTALMRWF